MILKEVRALEQDVANIADQLQGDFNIENTSYKVMQHAMPDE